MASLPHDEFTMFVIGNDCMNAAPSFPRARSSLLFHHMKLVFPFRSFIEKDLVE